MATTTSSPASTITWKLDPAHSSAEFKVKHMMICNVKGTFTGLSASLTEDPADPARSRVEASIDVSSINTGDAQRDAHLKSADFFDAGQHPAMAFQSTKVEPKGDGDYVVAGDLSMRGITKPVTFAVEGPTAPAKDPWGNTRIGLAAAAKISRKDFGLTWNAALETGGVLVGDEVQITIEAQFIKA